MRSAKTASWTPSAWILLSSPSVVDDRVLSDQPAASPLTSYLPSSPLVILASSTRPSISPPSPFNYFACHLLSAAQFPKTWFFSTRHFLLQCNLSPSISCTPRSWSFTFILTLSSGPYCIHIHSQQRILSSFLGHHVFYIPSSVFVSVVSIFGLFLSRLFGLRLIDPSVSLRAVQ
jgi:hypothetical protein